MGPFPHDAPPACLGADNPAGTDGFEFVEFAHPQPRELAELFRRMGFAEVARHKTKHASLWRQGDINLLVNAEAGSHGARFAAAHGPSAPSMAWRVVDARLAFERAVACGATPYSGDGRALDLPAIVGIEPNGFKHFFCTQQGIIKTYGHFELPFLAFWHCAFPSICANAVGERDPAVCSITLSDLRAKQRKPCRYYGRA